MINGQGERIKNMPHDFLVPVVDTDSITICKRTGAAFSQEEIETLTQEINSLTDNLIRWEFEFYIPKLVVLKSKNYILYDGKNIKTKGSALRDQKKEIALREFLDRIISAIIHNNENIPQIYHDYVTEILNVKDIKRWCSKKTITDKVLTNSRTNEKKVRDAIAGTEYKEADKVWLFFKSDESLCLAEKFDGDYDKMRLLEKLYKTSLVFESVLPVKSLFLNYSLKKNESYLRAFAGVIE
jgi:hypothetical protein